MSQTSHRVAVISGACGAIGSATAEMLAKSGFSMALVDIDSRVYNLADEMRSRGHAAKGIVCDVSDEQAVAGLKDNLGDWFEDVAVLINNAGISPKSNGAKRLVKDTPLEEWQRVMNINLTGPFLLSRELIVPMMTRRWGRVVMVASQAARTRTVVPGSHYQASKSGLIGFARVLAAECAPHGVIVNTVAPGRIRTGMTDVVSSNVNDEVVKLTPAGRMGTPQDIAHAISYLCSDDIGYAVGAIIDLNGGSFMP
jgi:3-oxoacyl-[acyl-carrier protein] reductase